MQRDLLIFDTYCNDVTSLKRYFKIKSDLRHLLVSLTSNSIGQTKPYFTTTITVAKKMTLPELNSPKESASVAFQ